METLFNQIVYQPSSLKLSCNDLYALSQHLHWCWWGMWMYSDISILLNLTHTHTHTRTVFYGFQQGWPHSCREVLTAALVTDSIFLLSHSLALCETWGSFLQIFPLSLGFNACYASRGLVGPQGAISLPEGICSAAHCSLQPYSRLLCGQTSAAMSAETVRGNSVIGGSHMSPARHYNQQDALSVVFHTHTNMHIPPAHVTVSLTRCIAFVVMGWDLKWFEVGNLDDTTTLGVEFPSGTLMFVIKNTVFSNSSRLLQLDL